MNLNIFCERQRGSMCRMHSINNYYGNIILNEKKFLDYCNEYDKIIKGLNSISMDGFTEGRSIVSYIMSKIFNKFLLLIPINSYKESRHHLDISHYNQLLKKSTCFFEFNKNHIWVNKKINGKFYKLDSLSGVNETNIRNLNDNGYFIVIEKYNLYEEINYIIKLINTKNINDINLEIYFYNLFFMLEKINLQIDDKYDILFNEKIVQLKNIKKVLYDYIIIKRKHKGNTKNQKIIIKNIINFFVKF